MTPERCTEADKQGRLAKARKFLDAAEVIDDIDFADAQISLCVLAGIAGSDVLCCDRLGKRSVGADHAAAASLLEKVDTKLAGHLRVLLGLKTAAGYGAQLSNAANMKRALRAAQHLVEAAENL